MLVTMEPTLKLRILIRLVFNSHTVQVLCDTTTEVLLLLTEYMQIYILYLYELVFIILEWLLQVYWNIFRSFFVYCCNEA